LTAAGATRFRAARKAWEEAQAQFETAFGVKRAMDLRALLHEIATEEKIATIEA
jgi:hypothetical protein